MSHTKSMFKGLHLYSLYNGDLCSAISHVRSVIRDTVGGRSLQEWLYWAVDNNNIEAVTYLLNSGVLVGDCYMLLIRAMDHRNYDIAYLLRIHHALGGVSFRKAVEAERCAQKRSGHTEAVLKEALDRLERLAHPRLNAWKPAAAYCFQDLGSSPHGDNVLASWPPRGSPQWPPKDSGLPEEVLHFQILQYWDAVRKLRRAEARSLASLNWSHLRSRVQLRGIALYWQEDTAKKRYGPNGAGRAADRAAWDDDPFFGSA